MRAELILIFLSLFITSAFAQSGQSQVEVVGDSMAEAASQLQPEQPQQQCAVVITDVKVNGISSGTIKVYTSPTSGTEATNNIELSYDLGSCKAQELCISIWRANPLSNLPSPREEERSRKAAVVKWWLLYGVKNYEAQHSNFGQFFRQSIPPEQYKLYAGEDLSGSNWFPHNLYDVQCIQGPITGQNNFSFTFSKSVVDATNPNFLNPSLGSFGNSLYFTVQVRTAQWSTAEITSIQDMGTIPWYISNAFSVPFDTSGLSAQHSVQQEATLHKVPSITGDIMAALHAIPANCQACSSIIHCLACLDFMLVASPTLPS